MVDCNGCRVRANKADADRAGWAVVEADGRPVRVFCPSCEERRREFARRLVASGTALIVSVRPSGLYIEGGGSADK